MTGVVDRAVLARLVGCWAASEERPLFVGNGYLLREVVHQADASSAFYLFGGMGLASAVAVGYAASCDRPAAVLEGDGNFYLGQPAALLCGASGLPIVHVVYDNGVYESTGSQPIPCSPRHIERFAAFAGYSDAREVTTAEELTTALADFSLSRTPTLIWAVGAPGTPVAPRPPLDAAGVADRFRKWAG